MKYHASVRYARTMTTSAQNAGRYESFHRAEKLGVDLTLEWQTTLDNQTRHSHRLLHGMGTTVDKPFVVDGVKIMYPAQAAEEAGGLGRRSRECLVKSGSAGIHQ